MDKKVLVILGIFIAFIGLIIGVAMMFGGSTVAPGKAGEIGGSNVAVGSTSSSSSSPSSSTSAEVPPMQKELNELSAQVVADLQTENRLNLNMLGQLRAYQTTLKQIQQYAKRIEKEINVIEEITKDEFQEDVKLQASLFTGKKSTLVAKHLEEFRPSRVGAILSKMKEKEASAVLDVWAKQKDPKVSLFYREAISAYLNNKRRDAHPELFDKLKANRADANVAEGATQELVEDEAVR